MNCHSVRNALDLRAEGRLSPRRAARVEAHLASCQPCRSQASLFERTAAAPAGGGAPEDLKKRLLAAARNASKPDAERTGTPLALWPSEAPAIALAAAALILVGLLVTAAGVPSQSSAGDLAAAMEEP
jgi:anti-sigma factor RsiW